MDGNSHWRRYLAIGVLSLLKAVALRRNGSRARRELVDAGLFLGVAALVRRVEGRSRSRESSWTDDVIELIASRGSEEWMARFQRALDQRDVQRRLREDVAPRLRRESEEKSERHLGERIRSLY